MATMQNEHGWKTRTEDGAKREVRATRFGKKWRIQSKLVGDTFGTYPDEPPIDDLRELREIIFRKYQRRRASHEELVALEQLISEREGAAE